MALRWLSLTCLLLAVSRAPLSDVARPSLIAAGAALFALSNMSRMRPRVPRSYRAAARVRRIHRIERHEWVGFGLAAIGAATSIPLWTGDMSGPPLLIYGGIAGMAALLMCSGFWLWFVGYKVSRHKPASGGWWFILWWSDGGE